MKNMKTMKNNALCYAIEGNVVDRVSTKNGKGWCEDISPTLNTQDRHAVVYALEGNGARPSHMGAGFSDSGKMYTLNTIEQHSVCYAIENHAMDSRIQIAGDVSPSITAKLAKQASDGPLVLIKENT